MIKRVVTLMLTVLIAFVGVLSTPSSVSAKKKEENIEWSLSKKKLKLKHTWGGTVFELHGHYSKRITIEGLCGDDGEIEHYVDYEIWSSDPKVAEVNTSIVRSPDYIDYNHFNITAMWPGTCKIFVKIGDEIKSIKVTVS